ncbi:hypothetical protein AADZ90_008880 [Aestuariibius sp. 2305UL40-4]|uniref:hypothetical protein n=1 Tax=Aestuariibius violaceus TaxID=3234132 RepID=UPI00345EF1BE
MQVTVRVAQADAPVLVLVAITSPEYDLTETHIDNTNAERITEEATGQDVFLCDGTRPFTVRHICRPGSGYPEAIFGRHDSRFTRASEALTTDARDLGTDITISPATWHSCSTTAIPTRAITTGTTPSPSSAR